jgi:hypothetical protein
MELTGKWHWDGESVVAYLGSAMIYTCVQIIDVCGEFIGELCVCRS